MARLTRNDALKLAQKRWGKHARVEYREKAPLLETPEGEKAQRLLRHVRLLERGLDRVKVTSGKARTGACGVAEVSDAALRRYRWRKKTSGPERAESEIRKALLLTAKHVTAATIRAAVKARLAQIMRLCTRADSLVPGISKRAVVMPQRCVVGVLMNLGGLAMAYEIKGSGDTWQSACIRAGLIPGKLDDE